MSFLKRNCCDGIYNSSIDVRFTKLCDNACDFCIEDMDGIPSLGKTNVDRMVKSVLLSVQNHGKDTVLILGGEPFLQPKLLLDFVSRIRDDVKNIYITTSVPRQLDPYDVKIECIMDMIDGLNISLHHWDWERNNQILKARNNFDRIDVIEELAWWWGDKIRLQCNLVKGGIESRDDVNNIVNLASKFHIEEVKFNELQGVGADLYVSFDELFPEFKLGQPYSKGCTTDVSKHFDYLSGIYVKRACFMVQKNSPHQASLLDLAKVIFKKFFPPKPNTVNVIYENGLKASGWLSKEALIFKTSTEQESNC